MMRDKMKKKVRSSKQNQQTRTGDIKVQHVLPNQFVQAIGPFILLDHIISYKRPPHERRKQVIGRCPLPYRGVAILTYIISGEVEHLDSMGNHVKLSSGGAHWMKAGKGIIQDETVGPESRGTKTNSTVVRFWINLPSKHKCEEPDYFALPPGDIPKQILSNGAGWIKILCGNYDNIEAKVPCYSKQFLYHVHVEKRKIFSIATNSEWEYAAFLPASKTIVNDVELHADEFIVFSSLKELIEINNRSNTVIDIILFGGQPYNEPIVVEETFVMNNPHEITQAYNDYYNGKYGYI